MSWGAFAWALFVIAATPALPGAALPAPQAVGGATSEGPLRNPDPPSTLLPPNTTAFGFSVQTDTATACRYAVHEARPFEAMTPFDSSDNTTAHQTVIQGIDPDPNRVNDVYVRCAAYPDALLSLRYRALPDVNPSYPRTSNLWGLNNFDNRSPEYLARYDLWMGSDLRPDQIRTLRSLNPNVLVLTTINAVEAGADWYDDVPDDFWLRNADGERVEVWPGLYRLNLTKPEVAEFLALQAYQKIVANDLMYDGVFLDNVFLDQSWLAKDIYDDPFEADADGDGEADDPAALDAAWRAGVLHELATFRRLMPHALMAGHALDIEEPAIAETFNGVGIGFSTVDVIEGRGISSRGLVRFPQLWTFYSAWNTQARRPHITSVESAPPHQIAYGYGYAPWEGRDIPPSTLEFARTYYPYMRFGLAFTLMDDGYFTHEFGDTWHGNDWWYDELDFDLGYPLGEAEFLDLGGDPPQNLIVNGGFERFIGAPWDLWVDRDAGAAARVSADTAEVAVGGVSARVDVAAASGVDWHINMAQVERPLVEGVTYNLTFWAKSDAPRWISVGAQKGESDWRNYGLRTRVAIDADWKEYTVAFTANETVSDAKIEFFLGEVAGSVWLDDVRLYERPPDVMRREFTNGVVLLNGSRAPQRVEVGPGYRRLQGEQAPRYQYILDDGDAAFSVEGDWREVTYDSGLWEASPPFYHDWGAACHEAVAGQARWDLWIPDEDTYTIDAWWPAAPASGTWSANVVYEVVAGGQVVASATLDQRTGGDEWHLVAQVRLAPGDGAYVRLICQGGAPCIADALHVRSAARYNDGAPAAVVTLQPMDGIILERSEPR
ncbi:MAG: hypothetical protein Kow00120_27220 [Anaerolineae bacterium]